MKRFAWVLAALLAGLVASDFIGIRGARAGLPEGGPPQGCFERGGEFFVGDVDGDGSYNLTDAVFILQNLFSGGPDPVACAQGNQQRLITGDDVVDGSLTGRDIADGSIREVDLGLSVLSLPEIQSEDTNGRLAASIGSDIFGHGRVTTFHSIPEGAAVAASMGVNDGARSGEFQVWAPGGIKATLTALSSGEGYLSIAGENGSDNIRLTSLSDSESNGFVAVANESGSARANLYVDSFGEGVVEVLSTNGTRKAQMLVDGDGAGFVSTAGTNGSANILLSTLSDSSDHGFVAVADENGDTRAAIYVDSFGEGVVYVRSMDGTSRAGMFVDADGAGVVFADEKRFVIEHPSDPGLVLVHSSLEGPEVGVYYRGDTALKAGEAEVRLPSYFENLTRPEGRTVQLTCRDGWSPLFVDGEVSGGRFRVRTTAGGNSTQRFSWEVKAVRADRPILKVEVSANEASRTASEVGKNILDAEAARFPEKSAPRSDSR